LDLRRASRNRILAAARRGENLTELAEALDDQGLPLVHLAR
jgi:hypothetical protein